MKFSKSLLRNEVPEWAQWYIDYKALKKLVKTAAAEAPKSGTVPDEITAPFFWALDRNTEMVNEFFNSKFSELRRRLAHLEDKAKELSHNSERNYNSSTTPPTVADSGDLSEFTLGLLEVREALRRLQWYAEVNKRGFAKILKKFDKKAGTDSQTRYLTSKILILPFTQGQELTDAIGVASHLLEQLAPVEDSTELLLSGLSLTTHAGSSTSSLAAADSQLQQAIYSDNVDALKSALSPDISSKTLSGALVRAVSANSLSVIPVLTAELEKSGYDPLANSSDINKRNLVHRIVISEARREPRSSPAPWRIDVSRAPRVDDLFPGKPESPVPRPGNDDAEAAAALKLLLDSLSVELRSQLLGGLDIQLRMPLHHAARHGLVRTTSVLASRVSKNWLVEPDSDGQTPLALSVAHNQPLTAIALLNAYPPEFLPPPASLLFVASRLDSPQVVGALLDAGIDIDSQEPSTGDSALHVATRYGHVAVVDLLLKRGANIELRDCTFEWTPLFVAAVDGNQPVAELLIAAGAQCDSVDISGWTPKEHAALRGHVGLSQLFPPAPVSETAYSPPVESPAEPDASLDQLKSRRGQNVLKTFGHRYLEDPEETLILIVLGSRDIRHHNIPPVELDSVPVSEVGQTQVDTALSLLVSASHTSSGEPFLVDLPVPELGLATEPIPFYTREPDKVQITFDLVPTYSVKKHVLGRGVARGPRTNVGGGNLVSLESLQSVPLVESSTLRVLGTVTFEALAVTPFVHANNGIGHSSTYWRSLITSRVIGHRGLGKNTLSKSSLQLGENTVESFIQAANLGASYVEFDVQLTKDGVPVIYHDFLVGDSGFDIPMHAITLAQFMHIQRPTPAPRLSSPDFSPTGSPAPSQAVSTSPARGRSHPRQSKPQRSLSLEVPRKHGHDDYAYAVDRMQHTRDFQSKGYKGNVRGMHIQSKFATLAELFETLPSGLGFNIEFKYPMLDEAEAEEMAPTAFDLNYFVDTILQVIFDHKRERDVILSSFNPDICVLLSLKQPSIPVLFLTEGGTAPMMDVRASSLQEAIRFARRWNLLGIVSEATPLIECPRLVRAVKESGLVCFTYGTGNNVPSYARRQLEAGVDAVIADSVLAIRRELTENPGDVLAREVSSAIQQAHDQAEEREEAGETSTAHVLF